MRAFVTGIGVISAIGNDVEETQASLLRKQSGISSKPYSDLGREYFTGEVALSNADLAQKCSYQNDKVSRTSLLGMKAALECWGNNEIDKSLKTGFISGTSVGGMDRSEGYFRKKLNNLPASFDELIYHDSGNTTEKIAHHLGITDYINTVSTACSSASNAILLGARLIKAGKLDRVLVGGSDALTQFTLSGFNSLMVFSDEWCQPFDENRKGLNLGEGAGYLLLESEESLKKTGSKVLGEVTGWSNTADAYHQTATSPNADGATMAVKGALEKAHLSPDDIDYVNAHGTSTQNNDLTESIALKNIFGERVPPFSSTKSYTGHTLAASGGIEAVFSILAIQEKLYLPNLNYDTVISETGLVPVTEVTKAEKLDHIVSNSFGFGGNCTSLIISRA